LSEAEKAYKCASCFFVLRNLDGILVDELSLSIKDKGFYDNIYASEHGQKWFQGLNRENLAKCILEKISLSYRRQRFFRKNIKGKNNVILDLACGAGRDYFQQFGTVVGIDLSFAPLLQARQRYDLAIQAGCDALPFADNTFDYVVSSDFFGHVRAEDKDKIIKEILRVMKSDGKTLHVIETDSANAWFRIAHRSPELFQKYFIEQIGGHVGLELPSQCVARWKGNGFFVQKAIKIWGLIWPVNDYITLFDNEYRKESVLVNVLVAWAKAVAKFKIIKLAVNIILNPINSLVEVFLPLDNGQGLMIVCQKKRF
jgi:SAM-dependent methyltransferase